MLTFLNIRILVYFIWDVQIYLMIILMDTYGGNSTSSTA